MTYTISKRLTVFVSILSLFLQSFSGALAAPRPVSGADLLLEKTSSIESDQELHKGDMVTYELDYENNGPEKAKDVVLKDTLPEGMCLNVSDLKLHLPAGATASFYDEYNALVSVVSGIDCSIRSFAIDLGDGAVTTDFRKEDLGYLSGLYLNDAVSDGGVTLSNGSALIVEDKIKPALYDSYYLQANSPTSSQKMNNGTHFMIDGRSYIAVGNKRGMSSNNLSDQWFEIDPQTSMVIGNKHSFGGLSTSSSREVIYFSMAGKHYLATVNDAGANSCNRWFRINPVSGSTTTMAGCLGNGDSLGHIEIDTGHHLFFSANGSGQKKLVKLSASGITLVEANETVPVNELKAVKIGDKAYVMGGGSLFLINTSAAGTSNTNWYQEWKSPIFSKTSHMFSLGGKTYMAAKSAVYRIAQDHSFIKVAERNDTSSYGLQDISNVFVVGDSAYLVYDNHNETTASSYKFDPQGGNILVRQGDILPSGSRFFGDDDHFYGHTPKGVYEIMHAGTLSASHSSKRIAPLKHITHDGRDYIIAQDGFYQVDSHSLSLIPLSQHTISSLDIQHFVNGDKHYVLDTKGGSSSGVGLLSSLDFASGRLDSLMLDIENPIDAYGHHVNNHYRYIGLGDKHYLMISRSGVISSGGVSSFAENALYDLDLNLLKATRVSDSTSLYTGQVIHSKFGSGARMSHDFVLDGKQYILLTGKDRLLYRVGTATGSIEEVPLQGFPSSVVRDTNYDSIYANATQTSIFMMNDIPYIVAYGSQGSMWYRLDITNGEVLRMPGDFGSSLRSIAHASMGGKDYLFVSDLAETRAYSLGVADSQKITGISLPATSNLSFFHFGDQNYLIGDNGFWYSVFAQGTKGVYRTTALAGNDMEKWLDFTADVTVPQGSNIKVSIFAGSYGGEILLPPTLFSSEGINLRGIDSQHNKLFIEYELLRDDISGSAPILRSWHASYSKKTNADTSIQYQAQITIDDNLYDSLVSFQNRANISSSTPDLDPSNNDAQTFHMKDGSSSSDSTDPLLVVEPSISIVAGDSLDLFTLILQAKSSRGIDLRNEVNFDKGDFDASKPGVYTVIYTLHTDGKLLTQQSTITVNSKFTPKLTVVPIKELSVGDSLDLKSLVTSAIFGDQNVIGKVAIYPGSFDSSVVGDYTITYTLTMDNQSVIAKSVVFVRDSGSTTGTGDVTVISGGPYRASYSASASHAFVTNCQKGLVGDIITYEATITKTASASKQSMADALAKHRAEVALAYDIANNGQSYANKHGKCRISSGGSGGGIGGLPGTGARTGE